MKLAWIQIALSLVIGFSSGLIFNKLSNCSCAQKSFKFEQNGKCHDCKGDSCKNGCKEHDCKNGGCKGYGHGKWDSKKGSIKKKMLEHFTEELSLTPDQKVKVEKIFNDKHKKMMELHEEIRPKFEALRKTTHEELKTILNPEQQKKLDELDAKREARHKEWDKKFDD